MIIQQHVAQTLLIQQKRRSGGASAIKEPGHFEVRKSSSQVTRSQGRSQDFLWAGVHFYLQKS